MDKVIDGSNVKMMPAISVSSEELRALVELINRAPLTHAEHLWAQAFFARLQSEIAAVEVVAKEMEKGSG